MKRFAFKQLSAFFLWMLFVGLGIAACSEEEGEKPDPSRPAIEDFNQQDLTLTEQSGSSSFTFTAHEDWVVSVAPVDGASWCTVSPSSGTAGTHTVMVHCEKNEGYDDRSVTITLKAGTTVKTFVVTQKQKDALLLTADKFEVPQEGGNIAVEVKANVDYTASIAEECRDWITENPGTRGLTASAKVFSVAPNRSGDKREGTITFSNGTLTETVHVYQAQGDVTLLTEDTFYADPAGDELTVELRSNCEYEVVMPAVDWVKQVTTRALSSHTLYYTVLPNDTYDTREAQIVYRNRQNALATDTLTIVQNPMGAIVLSERVAVVEQSGGTLEVKLSTNVDFEVRMPEDVDWISSIGTKGLTTHTLRYEVAPNEQSAIRSAKIAFVNEAAMLHDTLTVIQNGTSASYLKLHVSAPGTLGSLLTNLRYVHGLILSGDLNGDDIYLIRNMTFLTYLDLAEANIVQGGAAYNGNYHTEDNVVGDYMFEDCEKLQTCILPRSATVVGESVFEYCENLKTCILPHSVTVIGESAFANCTGLTTVVLPNGLETIGINAFYNCTNLSQIELPESVTSIEKQAFNGCKKLASIDIPKGVVNIEEGTFRDCGDLVDINIPEGVVNIGKHAFRNCHHLETITIPKSVTVIDEFAFYYCSALSEIILQEGLSRIEQDAFARCASLRWISLPSTITYLGYHIFYEDYSRLKEIWCYATVAPETGGELGINDECKLFIPKGSTGYTGYPWYNFGEIIEF